MSLAESLAANAFGPPHRIVAAEDWHGAVAALKADGYTYFDWLSAVDEHPDGIRIVLHVARLEPALDHLLLVAYLDREAPSIASVADIFAGARWHQRETHEMFGIAFTSTCSDVLDLDPLLLPDGFEGHPLRKEFVLASRVAKPWPGAKEPGPDLRTSAPSAGSESVQDPAKRGRGRRG